MQLDTTQITLLSLASAAAGWLINHWFSQWRDREARKRIFRVFLAQWRSKVDNSWTIGAHFSESIHAFRGERARVGNDFTPVARFHELADAISGLEVAHVEQGDQMLLLTRLDALINFTNVA